MSFERAAEVLEGVQRAPEFGVAAPAAPEDLAPPDGRQVIGQSRIRAARSWLFALGYLAADDDNAGYDPVLVDAVKAFQRDAGLTVDGWLGERVTWPRLQELIAFEEALDTAFWQDADGEPKPALVRAIATRLALYGFDAPRQDSFALDQAVHRFLAVQQSLGADLPPTDLSRASWLARVLDHDANLAAVVGDGLADGKGRPVPAVLTEDDDDPAAVAAFSLLLNMAKIELWLSQGAETNLDRVYVARRGFDRLWVLPSAIRGDLKGYMDWIDEEEPEADGLRRAYRRALRRGEPEAALLIFLDTARRFGQVQDPLAPERVAQLHTFYGGSEDRVPQRARETVKRLTEPQSLRARLWDGLGRIWSWLGRALRRAIQTGRRVLRLARDIASFAFRTATEGLRHIWRALGAFTEHVGTAIRRRHADPGGSAVIAREFGRDVNLMTSAAARPERVADFAEMMQLSAQIFRRACNVLGRAIGLGISIAGVVIAGPLVLRALIASVLDLRDVLAIGRELADLETRFKRLSWALAPG
ncbi:MAG: peptidoglycan-binding domain-containing protein [Pseudomonadota bacterium]